MRSNEAIGEALEHCAGGRVFFSSNSRSLIEEDEIELTSVGIDIGSSTSHLLFSKIVLERFDARYLVVERSILYQSEILLTPYLAGQDIDADALGDFIASQYRSAGLTPDAVDTGALILTGVALRRNNARAIGDLFSAEAGKFVVVSAGDALEALMAAHGSGALALSEECKTPVMNIDIGGGTTKIALCKAGKVLASTVVEAGARLVVFDAEDRIERIEAFGRRDMDDLGFHLDVGDKAGPALRTALAARMAEHILAAARGGDLGDWLRLPPLTGSAEVGRIVFSGGVSEFIYGREAGRYCDLGPELADAISVAVKKWGKPVGAAHQGIRATVVGASQYTVQVSGSTIFLDPPDAVPVRNVAVIAPAFDLSDEEIDEKAVASAVSLALARLDLAGGDRPVAVATPWRGSATFHRLGALCRGMITGLRPVLDKGHPLVLVVDGDIGGLIGIHIRQEEGLQNPIISIDGIELKEFDYVDIGEVLRATGAVPVVIKSLLFPAS
ncbi:MAG: ethanolamine utilization protein EutA [Alphaproteobacteria bacterium]|nr:MAG: ethanolamine utilization protein EutA [Alphaproteobacteria bacterium]